jgi:hypothetical protein
MKTYAFLLFALLFSLPSFAQQQNGDVEEKRKERIERLKRAYISEKLELTVTESEKFWPIYNEFASRKEAIQKELKAANKKLKAENLENQVVSSAIETISTQRKAEIDNDARFLKESLPVLGATKTAKLINVERDFKKEMLQRMKERREQGGGGQQRGQGQKGGGGNRP